MRFISRAIQPAVLEACHSFPAVVVTVPELFDYIRTCIERDPRKMGQWLFTGSQEAPLMQGVTESMAGRAVTNFPVARVGCGPSRIDDGPADPGAGAGGRGAGCAGICG